MVDIAATMHDVCIYICFFDSVQEPVAGNGKYWNGRLRDKYVCWFNSLQFLCGMYSSFAGANNGEQKLCNKGCISTGNTIGDMRTCCVNASIHQFFCTNSSTISHRTIEMDNDTDTYRMDPNIICMLRLLMAAIGNWDLPKRRRAAYTSISKYNDVS